MNYGDIALRVVRIYLLGIIGFAILVWLAPSMHAQTGSGRSYDGPVTWEAPKPDVPPHTAAPYKKRPSKEYCREHPLSKQCSYWAERDHRRAAKVKPQLEESPQ